MLNKLYNNTMIQTIKKRLRSRDKNVHKIKYESFIGIAIGLQLNISIMSLKKHTTTQTVHKT